MKFNFSDKIKIIKTFILPCFLFIFQSIPTHIPKSFFLKNKLMREFIWEDKTPRIAWKLLQDNVQGRCSSSRFGTLLLYGQFTKDKRMGTINRQKNINVRRIQFKKWMACSTNIRYII